MSETLAKRCSKRNCVRFFFLNLPTFNFILYLFFIIIILFKGDHFYQYGEIRSISIVSRQQCAFVTYANRMSAELAAEGAFNKLVIQVLNFFLLHI